MTWRELNVEKFNSIDRKVVIDVRSPCEHLKESIPEAVNLPLLSDQERIVIGTVYKQEGALIARRQAVGIIAPKIPAIVDEIMALKLPQHSLVVHCWRGGLRSEAVVSFLSVVGIDCFRLKGGYKAWRKQVVQDFADDDFDFEAIVLDGLTGVGKTEVLVELSKSGKTVLDLEALANHRGSTFGALGLPPQPSQKDFEAGLWMSLKDLKANQVFMEAESRRIGKLSIPTFLFKRMKVGRKILIESPFTLRLKRLLKDYTTGLDKDAVNTLITRSESIRQTMGNVGSANLIELLEKDDLNEFVEVLLHKYYDPLYLKHLKKAGPFELNLTNQDPAQTAEKIADYISSSSAVSSRPTLTDKLKIQQS